MSPRPGGGESLESVVGVYSPLGRNPVPLVVSLEFPRQLIVGHEDVDDLIEAELEVGVLD